MLLAYISIRPAHAFLQHPTTGGPAVAAVAECPGSASVLPLAGYWSSSPYSPQVHRCEHMHTAMLSTILFAVADKPPACLMEAAWVLIPGLIVKQCAATHSTAVVTVSLPLCWCVQVPKPSCLPRWCQQCVC